MVVFRQLHDTAFVEVDFHLPFISPGRKLSYIFLEYLMVSKHKYVAINQAIICEKSNSALNVCNWVINVYQKQGAG